MTRPDPGLAPRPPEPRVAAALSLLLAIAYAGTGHLGLAFAHGHGSATLVWPPSGIALAAIVLFGPRVAPGVFLGAALVNAWNGSPWPVAIGLGLGNTLEPLAGAALLARLGFDARLARTADVLALAGAGALAATLVGATCAVATLSSAGILHGHGALDVGIVWWLGDAAGVLVLAPVVLSIARGVPSWRTLATVPIAFLTILAVAASLTAFAAPIPGWAALFFALAGGPIVVAAGLRGGPRAAIALGAISGVPALVATNAGVGPLTGPDALSSAAVLVAYLVALSTTATLLAAAIRERDDAERARAQAAEENVKLARAVARSERLEAIGLVAGGVVHDFNNLLAVVRMSAATAKLDVPASSPAHTALDEIAAASARAAEVCAQLLGVADRAPMTAVSVDLRAIAGDTVGLEAKHAPANVSVVFEPGDAVPLVGDRGRLTQLVLNLVKNAIDALGERGGRVVVRLSGDAPPPDDALEWVGTLGPGPWISLEVEDDGPGMDEETRQRLFEPLFTTKPKGHGLGSAVILTALRAHHGAIAVASSPGRGTRCLALLPRGEPGAIRPSVPPPAPSRALLLADDEPGVRRATARALVRKGFVVTEASDGVEALAHFDAGSFDAVVLDVRMPRLSGPAALEKMREKRPRLPAVLLTGFATGDEIGDAAPVLAKPFDVDELALTLEAEVARRTLPSSVPPSA